jgi:hypothetical protein
VKTVKLKSRHVNQEHIIQTAKRFNVLKCGRRFGKTSLAEELIIEPALDGFPVAYYSPTYKDLSDFWRVITETCYEVIASKNEQLKQIRLITGGVIDMWSLDEPDSGRGRKYKRVVIDECEKARKLEQAWNGTIRATLTDYVGDAWFLSTPKFGDTYFKELCRLKDNEEYSHEWQSWTFTTYDNPHILSSEVDSARRTMSDLYFRCEYLAEDVDLKGMLWAFAFDSKKHITDQPINLNKNEPVYLSFDFNKNPISCSVVQHYDRTIWVLETIKLENSDIYALCDYILSYYPNCLYIVTGDATGRNTSALVKDNLNYYTVIRTRLRLGSGQMRQPIINPPIQENQVLVNSLLANYGVQIQDKKAKALIYDLKNVKISEDGKIEKSNRADLSQQADALDTFRYWCNSFMGWFLKAK